MVFGFTDPYETNINKTKYIIYKYYYELVHPIGINICPIPYWPFPIPYWLFPIGYTLLAIHRRRGSRRLTIMVQDSAAEPYGPCGPSPERATERCRRALPAKALMRTNVG